MAAEGEGAGAERALCAKLDELGADLDRVLKLRDEIEAAIEEARRHVRALTARRAALLAREGRLRGESGAVRRSLEAFRSE